MIDFQAMLKQFQPFAYLDKGEQWLPSRFDDYLAHCALYDGDKKLYNTGEVTESILSEYINGHHPNLYLKPDQPYHQLSGTDLSEVPFYGHVRSIQFEIDNVMQDFYALTYMMFYPYNGPYYPHWLTSRAPFNHLWRGNHEADLEQVTILVERFPDGNWGEWKHMIFNAHGSHQMVWGTPDTVEMQDGHPIVYIAQGSHACYPEQGTYLRILWFANDVTSQGKVWFPNETILVSEEQTPWAFFKGKISHDIRSPINHGWFNSLKNETTTDNAFDRTCCLCFSWSWRKHFVKNLYPQPEDNHDNLNESQESLSQKMMRLDLSQ